MKETYEDGQTKIEHFYPNKNHLLYYEWRLYYPNGDIKSKGFIKEGQQTGEWIWWYENGNIESRTTYRYGVEVDSTYCYYETGSISRFLYPIDTIKNIWHIEDFHENGQKKTDAFSLESVNLLDSTFSAWDEHGNLLETGVLDSSRRVGIWQIRDGDSMKAVEMDGTRTIKFE